MHTCNILAPLQLCVWIPFVFHTMPVRKHVDDKGGSSQRAKRARELAAATAEAEAAAAEAEAAAEAAAEAVAEAVADGRHGQQKQQQKQ